MEIGEKKREGEKKKNLCFVVDMCEYIVICAQQKKNKTTLFQMARFISFVSLNVVIKQNEQKIIIKKTKLI